MQKRKFDILDGFVVIESENSNIEGSFKVSSDDGRFYAILPEKFSKQYKIVSPALRDLETGEMALPTGRVIVRWGENKPALEKYLEKIGGKIIRDYGAGGVISTDEPSDPVALARSIADCEGIVEATPQVLKERSFKPDDQ